MLCRYLIELLGEIESQQQSSGAKARPLPDNEWSLRTVNLNRLGAGPNTIGVALKSVQELHFSHVPLLTEEPTACRTGDAAASGASAVITARIWLEALEAWTKFRCALSVPRCGNRATLHQRLDAASKSDRKTCLTPRERNGPARPRGALQPPRAHCRQRATWLPHARPQVAIRRSRKPYWTCQDNPPTQSVTLAKLKLGGSPQSIHQNEPTAEPRTITAARAISAPTIATMKISK
jgi:hypothetical protein